jgi:hypothetical protein
MPARKPSERPNRKKQLKAKVNAVIGLYKKNKLGNRLTKVGKNNWQIAKPLEGVAKSCQDIINESLEDQTLLVDSDK